MGYIRHLNKPIYEKMKKMKKIKMLSYEQRVTRQILYLFASKYNTSFLIGKSF